MEGGRAGQRGAGHGGSNSSSLAGSTNSEATGTQRTRPAPTPPSLTAVTWFGDLCVFLTQSNRTLKNSLEGPVKCLFYVTVPFGKYSISKLCDSQGPGVYFCQMLKIYYLIATAKAVGPVIFFPAGSWLQTD